MSFFKTENIALKGVSACVPEKIYYNNDYPFLSEKKLQMLIKTIGIEQKHHVNDSTTTTDLCFTAAESLISNLGWQKEEIGVLIFVTQSADYYLPSSAILLQHRLGLDISCVSLEINMGCSGYVYGLSVLSSLMQSTHAKKGLLLCGDVSTITCSLQDKSTYPLFGDAGTASALEMTDQSSPIFYDLNSDASNYKAIHIPHGGARNKISRESFDYKEIEPGITKTPLHLTLNGIDVFNFSINEVPPAIEIFLSKTGANTDTIDLFFMHQANKLMNESIRKKLGFSEEQCPYSLKEFGNTSSASIPLTMVVSAKEKLQSTKNQVLLSGFGVGLSWANALLNLDDLTIPNLSIYE